MSYQLKEINESIRSDVNEFISQCDEAYAKRSLKPPTISRVI